LNARLAVPLVAALSMAAPRADATVEMQNRAKQLGFPVQNCLYCHATPHSVDVMKQKAKSLSMSDGNCLACHGKDIPAKLNARGDWLAGERVKRGAKQADMAWLRDYKEPATPAKPKTTAKP
jgi:mono/diheme cytochrome c family protein